MSLLPALDGAALDGPDAIVIDGESSSWEALVGRADALARRLVGASAAAVPGTPTLDTVVAVVAGLRAGVPVVPVPADAGPIERQHILRDSGAALVVGEPGWTDVGLPTVPVPRTGRPASWGDVDESAPALVMYTSGTTGLPKGAVISRRALAADLDGLAAAWEWTAADVLVHGLPLFHVHGLVLGILGPLRVGSKVHHTGKATADRYAAARGTLYFGVPTIWSRLVAEPHHATALAAARLLVSGSAALPTPVFDRLLELTGQAPVERYGMTETLITLSTRAHGERRRGHVGWPIDGVETRVRDDLGNPVAPDGESIGGLQVRGTTLFDGYLNQPSTTAESMTSDGWFITGDAVTVDGSGCHRIVGRASIDIIKSGGFKVGAGEVEDALLSHPAVAEAAVVGVPDPDLGERIVGYVVADGIEPAALIDHVATLLSVHKRPREIRLVRTLPRTALGKVQKQQLRSSEP